MHPPVRQTFPARVELQAQPRQITANTCNSAICMCSRISTGKAVAIMKQGRALAQTKGILADTGFVAIHWDATGTLEGANERKGREREGTEKERATERQME
eukprot:13372401-Alexandrium_andersonii.AAC.1